VERMTHYFFDKESPFNEETERYRLFAVIDELYYWKVEGNLDTKLQSVTIRAFSSGFACENIREDHKDMAEINFSELKDQFGPFAYFVERAVSGFKSYLGWISPDPQVNKTPWNISLN
jgi:hypothetical protein